MSENTLHTTQQATNGIGLVAWGTKRGQGIFFHSSDINPKEPSIRNTLKDIRPVVRFNEPNTDFYALEFTGTYKVFTKYRSVYDWSNSSGGYLAITLYIPRNKACPDVIQLLDDLVGVYDKDYMDSAYRIKKEKENIESFLDIINRIKTIDAPRPDNFSQSNQNNNFGVIYYEEKRDIKAYFNDPVKSIFEQYQEVLFLKKSLSQKYKFESLVELRGIPKQRKKYDLTIQLSSPSGLHIHNSPDLTINGYPKSKDLASVGNGKYHIKGLYESDLIRLEVNEQGFEEERVLGKVLELVGRKDKEGPRISVGNSHISMGISLKPIQYVLKINVENKAEKPQRDAQVFLVGNFMTPNNNKNFYTDSKGFVEIGFYSVAKSLDVYVEKKGYKTSDYKEISLSVLKRRKESYYINLEKLEKQVTGPVSGGKKNGQARTKEVNATTQKRGSQLPQNRYEEQKEGIRVGAIGKFLALTLSITLLLLLAFNLFNTNISTAGENLSDKSLADNSSPTRDHDADSQSRSADKKEDQVNSSAGDNLTKSSQEFEDQTEEILEIQGRIDAIQEFANGINFSRKDINKYLDYIKSDTVTTIVESLNFKTLQYYNPNIQKREKTIDDLIKRLTVIKTYSIYATTSDIDRRNCGIVRIYLNEALSLRQNQYMNQDINSKIRAITRFSGTKFRPKCQRYLNTNCK